MARKKKVVTEPERQMGRRIAAARERLGVSISDLGRAAGRRIALEQIARNHVK